MDKTLWKNWINEVGGEARAIAMLIANDISVSTAEKLATGRYQSQPGRLLRKALSEIVGVDQEQLFPMASAKRRTA